MVNAGCQSRIVKVGAGKPPSGDELIANEAKIGRLYDSWLAAESPEDRTALAESILEVVIQSRSGETHLGPAASAAASEVAFHALQDELQPHYQEFRAISLPNEIDVDTLRTSMALKDTAGQNLMAAAMNFNSRYPCPELRLAADAVQIDVYLEFESTLERWALPFSREVMGPHSEESQLQWDNLVEQQREILAEPYLQKAQAALDEISARATTGGIEVAWLSDLTAAVEEAGR